MKRAAILFALLVCAASANATNLPNSYAASFSATYDASTGASGTLYVTVSITGTLLIPTCPSNYMHTPSVALKLPNGSWTSRVYGTAIPACSNMSFSHVFTLDLESIGCAGFPVATTTCEITGFPQIQCPIMGVFWEEDPLFGIEWAWTRVAVTNCRDLGDGRVRCTANYYCQNGSAPPDYQPIAIVGPGPAATFPPFWMAGALGWRFPNTYGWHWNFPLADLASVVPGDGKWKIFAAPAAPWNNSPFTCTNYDAGKGSVIPWPF